MAWASAICRMYYGGILTAAGRWEEAEAELGTSARLFEASYRALRAGAVVRLADLRVRQGRLEDAEELLGGHEHDAYAVRPLARLHLARGDTELAVTVLRRHLGEHGDGPLEAPVLGLLAEAEMAAGRVEEAGRVAARLAAIAAAAPLPVLRGVAEYAAGLVAARTGDDAAERLEAALVAFAAAALPLEAARARLALARLLAPARPQVARAEAKEALDTFDRLGARPDADDAAALLRTLGARGRSGPKHLDVLTKREQEVFHLLGLGLSNPEIGARLYISRKTVSHHVCNVLAKLGLRNRAEAAAFASGRGAGARR